MRSSDEYKNEYRNLNDHLLHSTTTQEAHEYTDQLLVLLDTTEKGPHSVNTERFTAEQMAEYNMLKDGMIAATHPEEVKFYEERLMHLIDQAEKQ